jgi:hypothetical protein
LRPSDFTVQYSFDQLPDPVMPQIARLVVRDQCCRITSHKILSRDTRYRNLISGPRSEVGKHISIVFWEHCWIHHELLSIADRNPCDFSGFEHLVIIAMVKDQVNNDILAFIEN